MTNERPLRWHFDGWAVARGNVRKEPPLSRGYRILVVGGWSALFGLNFVAYVTHVGALFSLGLAIFLMTWVGGKVLRAVEIKRARRNAAEATSRKVGPDAATQSFG